MHFFCTSLFFALIPPPGKLLEELKLPPDSVSTQEMMTILEKQLGSELGRVTSASCTKESLQFSTYKSDDGNLFCTTYVSLALRRIDNAIVDHYVETRFHVFFSLKVLENLRERVLRAAQIRDDVQRLNSVAAIEAEAELLADENIMPTVSTFKVETMERSVAVTDQMFAIAFGDSRPLENLVALQYVLNDTGRLVSVNLTVV